MIGTVREIVSEAVGEGDWIPWLVFIVVLTVASIDWWWWDVDVRVGGWLPAWMLWAIGLQLLLAWGLYELGRRWQR